MGLKYPEIENIEISPITDDVYHVSQVKSKGKPQSSADAKYEFV